MLVRSATLSATSFATSEIADGIADAQSWGPRERNLCVVKGLPIHAAYARYRSVSRPLIMFVNGPADA